MTIDARPPVTQSVPASAAAPSSQASWGRGHWWIVMGLAIGVTLAPLFAFNQTPSATLYNQLLALFGFGLTLIGLGLGGVLERGWRPEPVTIALLVMLAAALTAPMLNGLPWSISLSGAAMLLGAVVLVQAAQAVRTDQRDRLITLFCLALVGAGLLSAAVSFVQFFVPSWADGTVIARTGLAGRAVGNMRQPNHLASLLLWSCVAAVWLGQGGWLERRLGSARRATVALCLLLFLFVLCVLFSASRTGFIGVGLLAAWGLVEALLSVVKPAATRLRSGPRLALSLTPVMFGLSWLLVRFWTHASGHAFGAETRLSDEGAGSPSRLAILRNTWSLLQQNPWTGTGWGDFNFAWTMTPFPDRPVAFFDHCHNIVLQLLVELGWPAGLLVVLLLLAGFVLAGVRSHADRSGASFCAFMVVLMIGLHSMSEYPLWYAYFLLPTAFAFGLSLRRAPVGSAPATSTQASWSAAPQGQGRQSPASNAAVAAPGATKRWDLVLLGAAAVLLVPLTVWDYLRIVHIYAPPADAASLEDRMAAGQRSPLFDLQADYAVATVLPAGAEALVAAQRTGHHLIDTRLMVAWARSLAAVGEVDKARYLAQRLKEFRNPVGDEFFEECKIADQARLVPRPFQCEVPSRDYGFREMR
ncbi:PglL family O-oligosaccharyltransferase [Roseateles depolymerans]|uniref:PglL family O-oligosaccharyltransferase n=2 Tax=Roseateles depolymerans TaxID=76731 RepID=UPI0009FAEA4A|nr:O-antigen ligase family protein [Roseateles depolymerans]REG13885.1 O-antigen ligase [Roseateles depolymerans]